MGLLLKRKPRGFQGEKKHILETHHLGTLWRQSVCVFFKERKLPPWIFWGSLRFLPKMTLEKRPSVGSLPHNFGPGKKSPNVANADPQRIDGIPIFWILRDVGNGWKLIYIHLHNQIGSL